MKAVGPAGGTGGRAAGDGTRGHGSASGVGHRAAPAGKGVCNRPVPDMPKGVERLSQGKSRALPDRRAQGEIEVSETAPALFEGSFSSVRDARHVLDAFNMDGRARDITALVVSELATNAMLHAGGSFTLRLWHTYDWARIEVQDASARLPIFPHGVPVARSLSGRGLYIVEALCSLWGAELRDSGKVVWAEVGERPIGHVDLRHTHR